MTILYFSSSVGAIILAVTAGLSLSLVTAESTAKDGSSLAEEAAETTLLLLLLTGRRGHLVAGVLLNHARDSAGSTLKDSIGRSASNLVLEGLRATAVQLSHLKLASTSVAVTSVDDTLLVVLTILNAFTGQLLAVIITLAVAHVVPPLLDTFVGAATTLLNLAVSEVTLSRMMHHTVDDVIEEPIHVDTLVIDGVHELRNNPLHHSSSVSASNLVQDLHPG
jgi:hypothetical protein